MLDRPPKEKEALSWLYAAVWVLLTFMKGLLAPEIPSGAHLFRRFARCPRLGHPNRFTSHPHCLVICTAREVAKLP